MSEVKELQGLTIRPVQASDNRAVKEILESATEESLISIKTEFAVEDLQQAYELIRAGNFGLLAELPGDASPAGVIYGRLHPTKYSGKEYQALQIFGTAVHPRYRLNPTTQDLIVVSLLKEIITQASEKVARPPTEILPYLYELKLNARTRSRIEAVGGIPLDRYQRTSPVKTTNKPLPSKYQQFASVVREATLADVGLVVSKLNDFYANFDLYIPQTEEAMLGWLAPKTLGGTSLSLAKYYLISDASGEVAAGIGVFNVSAIYNIRVVKMPSYIAFLNRYLRLIPADGLFSPLLVSRVWYQDLELARALIAEVRRRENSRGRTLVVSYDPTGPIAPLFDSALSRLSGKSCLVGFGFPPLTENKLLAGYES